MLRVGPDPTDPEHHVMQEAAQQLKVGLSVLKRICRQMGLARWPYRTRQSLRGVIAKTQQYYRVRGDVGSFHAAAGSTAMNTEP